MGAKGTAPTEWIGVDLDGTLAEYSGWKGPEHIGKPIPLMVARVKIWLEQKKDVRIFTARASDYEPGVFGRVAVIHKWCIKVFGQPLPVTCMKDGGMVELWDDRAIQVHRNTGVRADGGF